MSVTNGVQRERARVALEPVSTVDGDRIRRIHRGQWSDKDDPLVRANPVPFAPLEDEDAAA